MKLVYELSFSYLVKDTSWLSRFFEQTFLSTLPGLIAIKQAIKLPEPHSREDARRWYKVRCATTIWLFDNSHNSIAPEIINRDHLLGERCNGHSDTTSLIQFLHHILTRHLFDATWRVPLFSYINQNLQSNLQKVTSESVVQTSIFDS